MRLFHLLVAVAICQYRVVTCQRPPPSPCPSMYYYETDGYQYFGVVKAPNPPPYGSRMIIKLRLSVAEELSSDYVGSLELYDDRTTVLRHISDGSPVKYKVYFPQTRQVPNLISIDFDGRPICSGPPAVGRVVTSIDLEHALKSGPVVKALVDSSDDVYAPKPKRVTCGTISEALPLVVKGERVEKGDWPWLVAVFKEKFGGLEFKCGGTLVSDKFVLTAAHCVTNSERAPVKPEDIVLRLGVHNIGDWADVSTTTMTVARIRVKDYFRHQFFDNDIAVMVMSRAVEFTDYIRPVCLWDGDSDQKEIYGREGTVVGWGKDETGVKISMYPKEVSVPIVSTTECRGSNHKFFRLTSNTTICAGNRQGSGPCTGDSGSGLYMLKNNRWTIRGIVSHALRDMYKSCDLYQYVIYTDCAMYVPWINEVD